jgi:archaellum component FlaF (FlaF/FlaG flagellin family)
VPYNILATVQEFVKNPSANFGLMAVNTKSSQEIDFASSEYATAAQRPKLTITYNGATAVMPSIAPAVRKGVTLRTQHRDLHLYAPGALSKIAVYRADGSLVMARELAAGEQAIVSGLGAGVYFIRAGNAREKSYTSVSLLP